VLLKEGFPADTRGNPKFPSNEKRLVDYTIEMICVVPDIVGGSAGLCVTFLVLLRSALKVVKK